MPAWNNLENQFSPMRKSLKGLFDDEQAGVNVANDADVAVTLSPYENLENIAYANLLQFATATEGINEDSPFWLALLELHSYDAPVGNAEGKSAEIGMIFGPHTAELIDRFPNLNMLPPDDIVSLLYGIIDGATEYSLRYQDSPELTLQGVKCVLSELKMYIEWILSDAYSEMRAYRELFALQYSENASTGIVESIPPHILRLLNIVQPAHVRDLTTLQRIILCMGVLLVAGGAATALLQDDIIGHTNQTNDNPNEPHYPVQNHLSVAYQAETCEGGEAVLEHLIAQGETLYRIAQMYDISPDTLASYNNLPNPDLIVAGKTLLIPPNSDNNCDSFTTNEPDQGTHEILATPDTNITNMSLEDLLSIEEIDNITAQQITELIGIESLLSTSEFAAFNEHLNHLLAKREAVDPAQHMQYVLESLEHAFLLNNRLTSEMISTNRHIVEDMIYQMYPQWRPGNLRNPLVVRDVLNATLLLYYRDSLLGNEADIGRILQQLNIIELNQYGETDGKNDLTGIIAIVVISIFAGTLYFGGDRTFNEIRDSISAQLASLSNTINAQTRSTRYTSPHSNVRRSKTTRPTQTSEPRAGDGTTVVIPTRRQRRR